MSQRDKDYYERNKAAIKRKNMAYYYADLTKTRAMRAQYRAKHRLEANERERLRALARRTDMLREYGGTCRCCGESEPCFLELDHTDGRGKEHRQEIGRGSSVIYAWLKRRGWPKDGFELLCANCHQGRHRNGGVCPHKGKADIVLNTNGTSDLIRDKVTN